MLSKEQYQSEYVRMMDSMRSEGKGELNCMSVRCSSCPLHKICNDSSSITLPAKAFEIVKAVENWSKEHPIISMIDKYKEIFGVEPKDKDGYLMCPRKAGFLGERCSLGVKCADCVLDFWRSEYKEPTIKE